MNLLIIDTTKKEAVIELYANGINYSQTISSSQKHNETLLQNVEEVLSKAKCNLKEINYFACVTGPGSFTGIRVGMATVKALSYGLNSKILASNVFEVLSESVENGVILLYSTSTTYYYANISNNKIENYGVIEQDKLSDLVKGKQVYCLSSEQELIANSYNEIETIKNYNYLLYQHFKRKAELNDYTKQHNFEPFYIQLSQAEREIKGIKFNG